MRHPRHKIRSAESLEARRVLDSTVVFNEIMYNSGEGENSVEWIEFYNQLAVDMDVSEWSVQGGIDFEFPDKTVVPGRGYVVITSDPQAYEQATGLNNALGPFTGRLSNNGENLRLYNLDQRLMNSVRFDDGNQFPVAADGSGVTLAKFNQRDPSEDASSWTFSAEVGGTPNAANFFSEGSISLTTLMGDDADAKAFIPRDNSLGLDWTTVDFDDSNWTTGKTGIGYERNSGYDSLFGLDLDDPPNNQPAISLFNVNQSAYVRVPFQIATDISQFDSILLRLQYDDGFVGYINGTEVARGNAPNSVTWNSGANGSRSDSLATQFADFDITHLSNILNQGENVLAIHGLNQALDSSDFLILPQMVGVKEIKPEDKGSALPLAINEIQAAYESEFWFELKNDGSTAIDLEGIVVSVTGQTGGEHILGAVQLDPQQHYVVSQDMLGFHPADGEKIVLYSPQQDAVIDSRRVTNRLRGRSSGFGNDWLYPTAATPGAPNEVAIEKDIVINEIMYHAFPHLGNPGTPATYDTTTVLPFDATWKYNQTGDNLGRTWYQTDYEVDGQDWRSGRGPVGYENETLPVALRTNFTNPNDNRITTYYLQTEFTLTADQLQDATDIVLRHMVDDGVIIYLNGDEVTRFNMQAGNVSSGTLANNTVNEAAISAPISVPIDMFQVGTNVVSAELHQGSNSSSDVVFGADLQIRGELTPAIPGTPFRDSDEEWIELFNRGQNAIDLSNWELRDAIEFEFNAGTTLAPGEFAVIASDADSLRAKYPNINIVGEFSGGLSNKTDRILLVDANNNPADAVEYFERGEWPEYADGGGSSLELTDPFADNSRGGVWAASDETTKSEWTEFSISKVTGSDLVGALYNEFIFGLLDSGEFLIDDISVQQGGRELMQNGSFQSDTLDRAPDDWRLIGNHNGSVVLDPDDPANRVLHVIAHGPQQHVHDHVETTFAGNTSIRSGARYDISFKAKWLGGNSQINNRLYFTRIGNTVRMDVPDNLGTPGEVNSTKVQNAGPTYSHLRHSPVLPNSSQPVTISVDIDNSDDVAFAQVFWRRSGGSWDNVSMNAASGDTFQATLPGQSTGRVVQFYVEATNKAGEVSTYPAEGAESRALYQVNDGNTTGRPIDTYRLVMLSSDERDMYSDVNRMSNHFRGATLIVNNSEIFYDVDVRQVGSRFIRPNSGYKIKLNPEQKLYGVHDSIRIDLNGLKEIVYKQMINRAGGSYVSMYDDLSYFISPHSGHTQNVILQLARFEDTFLEDQFERGGEGTKWELDDVTYPTNPNPAPEGLKSGTGVTSPDIENRGDDPEAYRGHLLIRSNRAKDDYSGIVAMAQAIHRSGNALYEATNEVMDVDLWMRHYATQAFLGNWDTYGFRRPKNLRIYQRPSDNKIIPLAWDFDLANLTDSLIYNGGATRLDEIRNIAQNTRLFWGHMWDLTNNGFNDEYISRWASHYGSLTGGNYSGETSKIRSRETQARSEAQSAIRRVDFEITTNGGRDLSVNESTVELRGTGWIDVRRVYWREGENYLDVTWTSRDDWQVEIPLQQGQNTISLDAIDFDGKNTGSDSINVSSTVSNTVSDSLRVSEINYNPVDATSEESQFGEFNNDDFEFIEVVNIGNSTINLLQTRFNNGIDFTFPAVELDPGDYGVVVKDRRAFEVRYGNTANVIGEYDGGLSNNGETIAIADANGDLVTSISYDDSSLWPQSADGIGATLVAVDPVTTPSNRHSKFYQWRASTEFGGSPGVVNADPIGVVINEVFAHSDPPLTPSDSIELYNTTDQAINIGGWNLSDAASNLTKYQIPAGTLLNANSYLVFDESDINPNPLNPGPNDFALSGAHGDDVWFTISENGQTTTFVDDVHFGASFNGISFGRIPNGTGRLAPQAGMTLGSANDQPRIGEVFISELNYNPEPPSEEILAIHSTLTPDDLEFVEIFNPDNVSVELTNWRIRGGIEYDLDDGEILPSKGAIIVVSFNPDRADNSSRVAAFRAYYQIGDQVTLVGGYSGKLSDNGERVELQRPDSPPLDEPDFTPRVWEDQVVYDNLAPWPETNGDSLHRETSFGFGNDADSWVAATPSPGIMNLNPINTDLNRDGEVNFHDADYACQQIRANDLSLDLNKDGQRNVDDLLFYIEDLVGSVVGDSNLDRRFNSGDLVRAFVAGQYEDGVPENSLWSTGDWNCDGDFGTTDLVFAFQAGGYQLNAIADQDSAAAALQDLESDAKANSKSAASEEIQKLDFRVRAASLHFASRVDEVFGEGEVEELSSESTDELEIEV